MSKIIRPLLKAYYQNAAMPNESIRKVGGKLKFSGDLPVL
jgi:hypothetical protein